jgi:hypothetical protein
MTMGRSAISPSVRRVRVVTPRRIARILGLLLLCVAAAPHARAAELRIMSWNVTKLSRKAGIETVRIIQGLAPDVALIQEWYVDYPVRDDIEGWVEAAFGDGFSYHRAESGYFKNGIVSRWPITASGSWPDLQKPNYNHDWAIIDIPGPTDLQIVSAHLDASDQNVKIGQIKDIIDYIELNFSNSHYLMLGGDFNTANRNSEPIPTLLDEANWSGSCWVTISDGTPQDQNGDDDTNLNRSYNYDWLVPNTLLGARITPLDLGGDGGPYLGGIVFDSRVFTPLSAVAPILYGDTANGDQDHCPIVKSYDILIAPPTPTPTPPVEPTPTPGPPYADWPVKLNVNGATLPAGGTISVTATLHTCLTPFYAYVRLIDPFGGMIYLQRIPGVSTRLFPVTPVRFIEDGPWVLDFPLDGYPVLHAPLAGAVRGQWRIQGAFLDSTGNLIGGINELRVTIE